MPAAGSRPRGFVVAVGVVAAAALVAVCAAWWSARDANRGRGSEAVPAARSSTTTSLTVPKTMATLKAPAPEGLAECRADDFTLRAPGVSYGMGTGYASIYFEPRDQVACRFPTSVRLRLLNGSATVVDETVRTTSGSPISGEPDGALLAVDVRHWAQVVLMTTNRDPDSPDGTCQPADNISTTRVRVDFPGAGSVALDTDTIAGCGYLGPGPGIAAVSARQAFEDVLDPNHDPTSPVAADCSKSEVTEADAGRTIDVGVVTNRFGICLDEQAHPLGNLNTDGCPFGHVSNLSVNGPDSYPVGFEVTEPGSCTVTNGDFRVTLVGTDIPPSR